MIMDHRISSLIFILCIIGSMSGCVDWIADLDPLDTTVFEASPTVISYDIQYGYRVTHTGVGTGTILYREDIPGLVNGTIQNLLILNDSTAETLTTANNDMIEWNMSINDTQVHTLGLSASVLARHYMIDDLLGSGALHRYEIQTMHPDIIETYCNPQGNDTTWFIQPHDPVILELAQRLYNESGSENTLLIAKHIFSWLKQSTTYAAHPAQPYTQPATQTLHLKTGDCDDLSFLYLSLCRAVNIPARFVKGMLIENNDGALSAIHHLWVEIFVGGDIGFDGWIPVECAGIGSVDHEIYQHFGVEDASHLRLFIDDGTNQSIKQSNNHINVYYQDSLQIQINQYALIQNYSILDSQQLCISPLHRYLC